MRKFYIMLAATFILSGCATDTGVTSKPIPAPTPTQTAVAPSAQPTPTPTPTAKATAKPTAKPTVKATTQSKPSAKPAPSPSTKVWDEIAECESGGDWSINTGNGYYGGLQFSLPTWRSTGGTGYPHEASKSEQIARAEILQDQQGWEAWPICSKKAGVN